MPYNPSFERSRKLIGNLVKTFISSAFLYSDFARTKDILADLAALEIIPLDTKPLQLNEAQYLELVRQGLMKKANYSSSSNYYSR